MKRIPIESIPYEQVKFKFVSSHYDIHLKGTCIFNGELCEFESDYLKDDDDDDDDIIVNIYKLTIIGKLKWYFKQWMFEKCVGYHCSYPRRCGVGFYYRKPVWLYTILFNMYYKRY